MEYGCARMGRARRPRSQGRAAHRILRQSLTVAARTSREPHPEGMRLYFVGRDRPVRRNDSDLDVEHSLQDHNDGEEPEERAEEQQCGLPPHWSLDFGRQELAVDIPDLHA